MELWIIGGLVVALLNMINVYRIALREIRELTNYALLILLDDGVHNVQRASLAEFVGATDAKHAGDLGVKVRVATHSLAAKLYENTVLGVNGRLWKLKTGLTQPDASRI
jgi:hypothetical protein